MTVLAFPQRAQRPARLCSTVRLGMTQLSPDGLSEQWLLRDCGDRHWSLIADAMGQDRAVFRAADGRPIYAAFCVTALDLAAVTRQLLGQDLSIASALYHVTASRLGSLHTFMCDKHEIGRLAMISTFISHDATGSNRRIVRNQPARAAILPEAPEALHALSEHARGMAKQRHEPQAPEPPLLQTVPCPQIDFNAVGLLYFPAFSKLAQTAQWQASPRQASLAHRTVVYLGNIDPGDVVTVHRRGDDLDILRTDGRSIARVQTRRHAPALA